MIVTVYDGEDIGGVVDRMISEAYEEGQEDKQEECQVELDDLTEALEVMTDSRDNLELVNLGLQEYIDELENQ